MCYRCQLRCSSLVQTNIETTSMQQLHNSVNENWEAQYCCSIVHYPPPTALSQRPMSLLFGWVTQRVPTEQATRIRLTSLRAFALLLSLLAPSKATKTLHELQHALTRQQLSVMPRIEEKKQHEGQGKVSLTPTAQV